MNEHTTANHTINRAAAIIRLIMDNTQENQQLAHALYPHSDCPSCVEWATLTTAFEQLTIAALNQFDSEEWFNQLIQKLTETE